MKEAGGGDFSGKSGDEEVSEALSAAIARPLTQLAGGDTEPSAVRVIRFE